jgi:hypothetical protein
MRKVNLRNIDSTIDDPDASTWCTLCSAQLQFGMKLILLLLAHPTLRRNSPVDVIANFKRRVPPRLPKPRKRPEDSALTSGAPRSAVSLSFVLAVDKIRLLERVVRAVSLHQDLTLNHSRHGKAPPPLVRRTPDRPSRL